LSTSRLDVARLSPMLRTLKVRVWLTPGSTGKSKCNQPDTAISPVVKTVRLSSVTGVSKPSASMDTSTASESSLYSMPATFRSPATNCASKATRIAVSKPDERRVTSVV